MFEKGTIWAYPTDTCFGLGVRADDLEMLEKLMQLKKRSKEKYFSLMCRDFYMLKCFAHIPVINYKLVINEDFFYETPRTVILKPTDLLPKTAYWPENKVAFRVCTNLKIAEYIKFPVTATSANISGSDPIYSVEVLKNVFGNSIKIYEKIKKLPVIPPSEIWDFTITPIKQIR